MKDRKQFINSGLFCFLTGLLAGFVVYLCIYGFGYLNVTNVDWIYNADFWGFDFKQHYNGWLFFRDSAWTFPLGLTDCVSYPRSTSILFLDSIPLFAFIFKLFSGILPEHFQYMGLFAFLCFGLQGAMGSLIVKKYTDSKFLGPIFGALFALSPIMLNRVYVHTALSAHFLILIAVYFWLSDEKPGVKMFIRFGLLGFFCVWIQMYFVPLCGIILVAYVIEQILKDKKCWWKCVLLIAVYCLMAVLALWMFGGFYGTVSATGSGLGVYGANLNTFFNSLGSSLFFPELPTVFGQYEGYAYPGLGVYLLLVIALVFWLYKKMKQAEKLQAASAETENTTAADETEETESTSKPDANEPKDKRKLEASEEDANQAKDAEADKEKKKWKRPSARAFAVLWIVVICLLIAFIPKIYLGSLKIAVIPLPSIIEKMLGIFRSSGRFLWPVVYLILLCGITLVIRIVKEKKIILVVAAFCLIMQIVDLHPILTYRGISRLTEPETVKEFADFAPFLEGRDKFDYLAETLGRKRGMISNIAANHKMKVTESYISRQDIKADQAYRKKLSEDLLNGNGDDAAIYVLHNAIYHSGYNLHTYLVGDTAVATTKPVDGLKEYDAEDNEFFYYNLGETDITDAYDKTLQAGAVTYGEEIAFDGGNYTLELKGSNLDQLKLFVVYGADTSFEAAVYIDEMQVEKQTKEDLKVTFTIPEYYQNISFAFANPSEEDGWVDRMYLTVEPIE